VAVQGDGGADCEGVEVVREVDEPAGDCGSNIKGQVGCGCSLE